VQRDTAGLCGASWSLRAAWIVETLPPFSGYCGLRRNVLDPSDDNERREVVSTQPDETLANPRSGS
jgi:hypothetical protein